MYSSFVFTFIKKESWVYLVFLAKCFSLFAPCLGRVVTFQFHCTSFEHVTNIVLKYLTTLFNQHRRHHKKCYHFFVYCGVHCFYCQSCKKPLTESA